MKQLCDILEQRKILYDWYVLGTAFSQETFDEIYSWFKKNSHVHFLGYKDNVYSYIKNMDYLVLLTDREANCLVIYEALMLGVPCITTNFVGVNNQITDKENGIILEMTNENNHYEKRLDDILALKETLKQNVKEKDYGREQIINEWEKMLSK